MYKDQIPIYPIFYLLQGDYRLSRLTQPLPWTALTRWNSSYGRPKPVLVGKKGVGMVLARAPHNQCISPMHRTTDLSTSPRFAFNICFPGAAKLWLQLLIRAQRPKPYAHQTLRILLRQAVSILAYGATGSGKAAHGLQGISQHPTDPEFLYGVK